MDAAAGAPGVASPEGELKSGDLRSEAAAADAADETAADEVVLAEPSPPSSEAAGAVIGPDVAGEDVDDEFAAGAPAEP